VRLTRRVAGVLAPALLSLTVTAAPAAAAGEIDIETPLGGLSFERLAPGYGGTAEVRVVNGSEHDAEVTLGVEGLVEDENGCIGPETRDGDTSCDAVGGELGSWLRMRVEHDGVLLWEGPMTTLVEEGVVLDEAVGAGTELPLTVGVSLPVAAGNDTMTDRAVFSLRVDAMARTGGSDAEILGVEAFANGGMAAGQAAGGGGDDRLLPLTGGTVGAWLLGAGSFLVGAGSCLLVSATRRRQPRARPA
jgi:hypothetical protein